MNSYGHTNNLFIFGRHGEGRGEKEEAEGSSIEEIQGGAVPPLPGKKVWKPKFDLPKLESYRGEFSKKFWNLWPVVRRSQVVPPKSWADGTAILKMARQLRYGDEARLQRVMERLKAGADIGCRGRGRLPTAGKNAN